MCPAIAVVVDWGSAHDGFAATPILSGSPNVLLQGRAVARQGDPCWRTESQSGGRIRAGLPVALPPC